MEVFISWSGKSSRILAEALYEYFPMIIQDIVPFISKEISKGADWNKEIGSRLKNTNFGIICLTPDNLTESWLLFESGAISVNIDNDDGSGSHVATLLLDMQASDINFPLGQFQATLCTKQDILKLLNDINKFTNKKLDETSLNKLFEKFWPDIEIQINEAIKHVGENAQVVEKRSQDELLDELVKGNRLNQRAVSLMLTLLEQIETNTAPKSLQNMMNKQQTNSLRQGLMNLHQSTDVSGGTNEEEIMRSLSDFGKEKSKGKD